MTTRHVPVSDATILLEDIGHGLPVLLLHGFPMTRRLWSAVAPRLTEEGFRVLVPDLVGYGDSQTLPSVRVDMASQARWLLKLLDALHIDRAAIVAHDVGSAAAQLILAGAPRRVRGLAVLDGVHGAEWAIEAVRSIQTWNPADAARLFPVLARRLGSNPALRHALAAYEGEAGGQQLIRAARDLDPRQTEHIGDQLRDAHVPCIVIWGQEDRYLPVETVGRPLAELLEAPLVTVPGGHFTPLESPEPVTQALQAFLAQLPP
jgi:pimeloyl-ACP methyl ester carboxylesterase